jgi:catechol-2,3-dioxygenase
MLFHHVQLLTSNITKQLEFYQNTLELLVLAQSKKAVTFQIGLSKLEFVQSSQDVFYHFAFNIPSHQFAEAKEWLSKRVDLIRDSVGKDAFLFL